ncbi:MAG: hypothetical protein V4594_00005, partial [Bacteroidota bacterium]
EWTAGFRITCLLLPKPPVYDIARQNDIIAIWKELRDLAHPDSEYSAAVKFCLQNCGQDWALNIALAA